ncbi:MAG TPA: porin [Chitinophagaceae bacterium]|nr:porin [Chitinophagaceae bacterium]
MQHLLRRKIIVYTILLVSMAPVTLFAQRYSSDINLPNHDEKPFRFGISLGMNRAFYKFTHHPSFQLQDSVLGIESINSSGIQLAWLVNMRLSEHFDLRTYPLNLVFTEKAFQYSLKYPDRFRDEDSITTRKVQSISMALPIQIKFSSDRIRNFKVYMIAGGRIEYDFAATSGAKNAENLIKLNKIDYGIEGGIGFHFYFPYFVLSPELKFGYGLRNVHSRDNDLKFSNTIDKINSRIFNFSLIVE